MRLIWNSFSLIYILTYVSFSQELIAPKGNIYKQIHDNVSMTCESKEGSATLSFFNGSMELPRENIKILDERKIQLNLVDVQRMNVPITCKQNGIKGIDVRRVLVDTPPKRVEDFRCFAYDFEYFECSFTKPDNYIDIAYNLSYVVATSRYICRDESEKKNRFLCNITLQSGRYRQVHNEYNFSLYAENKLGKREDIFFIKQFDNVIPGKPNMYITNIEPNSAILEWDVRKILYHDTGLMFNISILSTHNSNQWENQDINKIQWISGSTKYSYKLHDLDAYTWYEVALRLKVTNATDTPEMWTTKNITFKTDSKEPDSPPTVDIGSFLPPVYYNATAQKFSIYWKGVPKNKENAANLSYIIKEVKQNNQIVDIQPVNITNYSAKFEVEKAEYEFTIHTVNNKGISQAGVKLTVPLQANPQPEQIYKIYKMDSYILRWSEPKINDGLKVKDYTVFSCISKSETSDECEGGFDFTHVKRDERNFTYHAKEKKMNFAISANYFNGRSSGMVWAMCTGLESSDFGVIKPKMSEVNATNALLEWNVECLYSAVVQGFRLKYCPMHPSEKNCTTDSKTLDISGELREFVLNDLKPYTTYGIWMYMYSATKQGPESSSPLSITTLESAPSPPRNLSILNVTNNSITLQWTDPEFYNGVIRYYRISSADGEIRKNIEANKESTAHNFIVTLDNLYSHKRYKIFVKANTANLESEPSNMVNVETKIGVPSRSEQPLMADNEYNSAMIISWSRPELPSGPIDFYELKITIFENRIKKHSRVSRIKGTQCTIQTQKGEWCQKSWTQYDFSVRAVNALPTSVIGEKLSDDDNYRSIEIRDLYRCEEESDGLYDDEKSYLRAVWSTPVVHYCHYLSGGSPTITIILSIVGFVFFMIFTYLGSKKFMKMKDIAIKFPPGLADLDQESGPKGCDNTITRDNMTHSEESLFKNENHKLLDSHRMDSGYMNGLDGTDKSITGEFGDDSSIDAVRGGEDDSSSRHAETVEMSDMSESLSSSPAESPNMNLRESISPTQLIQRPTVKPIIINGYVQHESFQAMNEPTIAYQPMEVLEKLSIQQTANQADNDTTKHKDQNQTNNGAQENICGYVTHKQLSDFGLRQQ